jgi:predicted porin
MNKKLIAAAVAAGLAMPGLVMADATVYGKLNVGIVSYDHDVAGDDQDGMAVFDEASRLGFKGEEDIGNGLKAVFQLEGTVDMDQGGYSINRDTKVGLKGGFGTVLVGRFNTAYKMSTGKMDIFADRWGDITGTGTHGDFDTREPNMFGYQGKFGALKFEADVNFSESDDDGNAANGDETAMGMSVGVNFDVGPVNIGAGYISLGGTDGSSARAVDDNAIKIGAQWKGPLLVNVLYELMTDDSATTDADTEVLTGQVAFGSGNNTFGLSYTMSDPDGNNNDCTQMSAGWLHKLSKKTELNVIYSTIDNDAGAACTGRFGNASVGYTTGTVGDPSGLAIGIQHNF